MKVLLERHTKSLALLQSFFIYAWLTNLVETDSYFSVYLLCAIIGFFCMCDNVRRKPVFSRKILSWVVLASAVFSIATLLANYMLFEPFTALLSMFNILFSFLGGGAVGLNVLLYLLNRLPVSAITTDRRHPACIFLAVFASIVAIDLVCLIYVLYPGVLTTDSVSTMVQISTGSYNNIMPFWHTMTVELFYDIGFAVFGEANAAVAFFHGAQIIFMAACFAYALMTLYQTGVPVWYIAVFYCLYAFLPYQIVYSVTMWKDVLFGGAVLLFVTALYRILRNVGSSQTRNYGFLIMGGIGLSLWRTNGWYAFAITVLVMLVLLRKRYKKLLAVMGGVLVLCLILIHPLLSFMNVQGTDFLEAFAVPFQQLARVIVNERELTEEETELLSQAFRLERVKEVYTSETVDPVKYEAFRHNNREFVEDHISDYVRLYLRLGLRYPGDYLKAWIDETKGYWNGGYSFWIYTKGIDTNDLGLQYTGGGNQIASAFNAFFRYLEKPAIFQPLYSIGLQVWIVMACCLINALKKREEFTLTIPVIVLIVGLWLGTPVYAEFRYAYPFFLTVPVILASTLFYADQNKVLSPERRRQADFIRPKRTFS